MALTEKQLYRLLDLLLESVEGCWACEGTDFGNPANMEELYKLIEIYKNDRKTVIRFKKRC
jgi:hypothetical protein